MTRAVLDADFIRYAVACAGETRSILVTHKNSGRTKEFSTRTEFWGDWRKKDGGYLAEINKSRTSPFTFDEFDIEDVQRVDKIENVLHSAKRMYENIVKQVDASSHIGFLGKGKCFRHDLSTILEYKGNRTELIKPLLMDDVTEYMLKKFRIEVMQDIEADDACIIEAYNKPDHVVIAVDKDAMGCPVKVFNPHKPDNGIIDANQFGKLYLNSKNEVKGVGRMFFYFQVAYGDSSDNYKANSASSLKWGEKSAYKALVNSENDKQALQSLVDVYKKLYPTPTVIKGWRGDDIEVDWLYALSENFHLARMLRTMDELTNKVEVVDWLNEYGVDYV